jgi:hypothetical protein
VHVGFADDTASPIEQRLHHGRVMLGASRIGEGCAAGPGGIARNIDRVLDADARTVTAQFKAKHEGGGVSRLDRLGIVHDRGPSVIGRGWARF